MDILGGYFVNGENGEIRSTDGDIRLRWKHYFNELFIYENSREMEELKSVEKPLQDVTSKEVKIALKLMKTSEAPGRSGLNSDILKKWTENCA